jgi:hypothetical protein
MKQNDPEQDDRPRDLIVIEGGATTPVDSDRDPYERLDDLMVMIEALCPHGIRSASRLLEMKSSDSTVLRRSLATRRTPMSSSTANIND